MYYGFVIGLLLIPIGIFSLIIIQFLINIIKSIFINVVWTCPELEQMPVVCSLMDSFSSNLAAVPLILVWFVYYYSLITTVIIAFLGGVVGLIVSKKINRKPKK